MALSRAHSAACRGWCFTAAFLSMMTDAPDSGEEGCSGVFGLGLAIPPCPPHEILQKLSSDDVTHTMMEASLVVSSRA